MVRNKAVLNVYSNILPKTEMFSFSPSLSHISEKNGFSEIKITKKEI